ncbi:MAG: helix-turn-helix domain-containing protein [Macellibacteroides sp.]|uniref:helix-turn-helix domain-containing protein n=1 Tax=Macellibacteroides sp. TaxID=2014584 RepID=UPI003E7B735A
MKNQLDEQLFILLGIVEKLGSIVSDIKMHTKSIIELRMNEPSSISTSKKEDSLMKHTKKDQSDERVNSLIKTIETLSSTLSEIRKSTMRRPINNELHLTDKELSVRLKVSRRTLQGWRYSGQISYFRIGGKMAFRESDIQAILEKIHN